MNETGAGREFDTSFQLFSGKIMNWFSSFEKPLKQGP